jgi:hypothetical protein
MRSRAWAAVLASSVLLTGCGWFGPPGEPHVAPGPRLVDAPYACPTLGKLSVATPGASTLPTGAIAARLCVTDTTRAFLAPRDDLTTHLDRLVRLVNRERITGVAPSPSPMKFQAVCGGPTPAGFAIVLRYPGGTRTITGNAVPCQGLPLQVGDGVRANSMRVWHAFVKLLAEQRRHQPARGVAVPRLEGACPMPRGGAAVTPIFDVRRVVAAHVCPLDRTYRPIDHTARRLDRNDLSILRADLQGRRARMHGRLKYRCDRWGTTVSYLVVMVDVWGDRSILSARCDTYRQAKAVETLDEYGTVRPLPATARMLRRLLEAGPR